MTEGSISSIGIKILIVIVDFITCSFVRFDDSKIIVLKRIEDTV